MKPEQPGPQSYKPRTSSPIEFQFKWRNVRVNPQNIGADFPFHLELEQNRYAVRFLEFRSLTDPPFDIGNPGDIWLNVSSASYALFALNAKKEWLRWPGPTLAKDRMILHPYLPIYTLWCTIKQAGWYHGDKVGKDWIGEKLTARQELGGYSSMESMLDASVGVRLILLREEIERTKPFTEPVDPSATSLTSSIGDQLKSALDQMTSTSTLPEMQQALISTLSSGIDYLLTERKKLSQTLFEVEERAAVAELKLAGFNASSNHYRAHCHETPLVQSPTPTPHSSTTFPLRLMQDSDRDHPPDGPAVLDRAPSPSNITSKHLDILFRPADEGRSKHCRICLDLVAYIPSEEISALMIHALESHPDECAVFASASDEELELARREFVVAG